MLGRSTSNRAHERLAPDHEHGEAPAVELSGPSSRRPGLRQAFQNHADAAPGEIPAVKRQSSLWVNRSGQVRRGVSVPLPVAEM